MLAREGPEEVQVAAAAGRRNLQLAAPAVVSGRGSEGGLWTPIEPGAPQTLGGRREEEDAGEKSEETPQHWRGGGERIGPQPGKLEEGQKRERSTSTRYTRHEPGRNAGPHSSGT